MKRNNEAQPWYKDAVVEMFGETPKRHLTDEDNEILKKYSYDKRNPRWSPIKINGKETTYEVNTIGQIRNKTHHILKLSKNESGLSVNLQIDKKGQYFRVEDIVAYTFLTNLNSLRYVIHVNGNPYFNWFRNLQFSDKREVSKRSRKKKSIKEKIEELNNISQPVEITSEEIEIIKEIKSTNSERTYTESQIIQIFDLLGEDKLSFSEISRITNCSRKLVTSIFDLASVLSCIDNS